MAIETAGSVLNVLKNYNAKDWTKSAQIGTEEFKLADVGSLSVADLEGSNQKSFSDMLASSITEVNSLQGEADVAIQKLSSGQGANIHETMLAVEKADIAFRTMNQVRLKVIDAYKEIMRMQI
jgi:flagellar hook-basal body complex protein FliE